MRIQRNADGTYSAVNSTRDVQVVSVNESTLVAIIKTGGYSENPGSRYSGMRTYYPVERDVYQIEPIGEGMWKRARHLIAIK